MNKFSIPFHVIPPGSTKDFVKQAEHPPTNSTSLRYAALWALGARDTLSSKGLDQLEAWCRENCASNNLFPDPTGLESLSFIRRLKDCPEAAINVSCYPGNNSRRTPSYADMYKQVWIEQRWPNLCALLIG